MISHEAAFGLSEATIRLSYSFSLGPITWSIKPGDRWLVLGENGSGKSAVLSALAGMGDRVSGDRAVPSQCAVCLLYTSPSPRDGLLSRMPSSA